MALYPCQNWYIRASTFRGVAALHQEVVLLLLDGSNTVTAPVASGGGGAVSDCSLCLIHGPDSG